MIDTCTNEMQELLLATLPQWRYRIVKPFKAMLDDGISLEMYYCLKVLNTHNDMMTMSEIARRTRMPKQQMTKMVNRLIEADFVERVLAPDDRRLIKLKLTENAMEYLNRFSELKSKCFTEFIDAMTPDERAEFASSLESIHRIFNNLSLRDHCENTYLRKDDE